MTTKHDKSCGGAIECGGGFVCNTCGCEFGWCLGADDEFAESCSDCWVEIAGVQAASFSALSSEVVKLRNENRRLTAAVSDREKAISDLIRTIESEVSA